MSTQTLRDNAARFRKDKLLFNLINVRHGNDVELEVIQIRATETVIIQKKFEGNKNNREEVMKNVNKEEDEEIRLAR